MYQVIVGGHIAKEYPDKFRAYVWCHMHGHIATGQGYYWLVGAKIKEEESR